jgi:hypothetical protein
MTLAHTATPARLLLAAQTKTTTTKAATTLPRTTVPLPSKDTAVTARPLPRVNLCTILRKDTRNSSKVTIRKTGEGLQAVAFVPVSWPLLHAVAAWIFCSKQYGKKGTCAVIIEGKVP